MADLATSPSVVREIGYAAGGVPFQGMANSSGSKSNVWYYLGQTATTSNAMGNGTLRGMGVYIPTAKTIDRIGAEVTSAGESGSVVRLGIYNDDGTGYPGALLLDAGTIDGTSATVQPITISQAVNAGLYWFVAAVQAAPTTQPTLRVVSAATNAISGSAGGSAASPTSGALGFSQGSVTGALAGTFTSTITISGGMPRVFWRFA